MLLLFLCTCTYLFFTFTCLFLAKSAMDFRHILPDRVLGKPLIDAANLKAAIGPISSLTMHTNSRFMTVSFLRASVKKIINEITVIYSQTHCNYLKQIIK